MTTKFSQVAHRVADDWRELLPHLTVWRKQFLVWIVGPVLSGVLLDRRSPNDSYYPSAFAHDLTGGDSEGPVTLDLDYPLRIVRTQAIASVPVRAHADRYVEACRQLVQQSLLPINRPPTARELEACFLAIVADMEQRGMPTSIVAGNARAGLERLALWLSGSEELRERVRRRIEFLKLERIPRHELSG